MGRPSEALSAKQTIGVVCGLLRGYETIVLAAEMKLYPRQVSAVRKKLRRLRPRNNGYGCQYYGKTEGCEGCLDRADDWVCPYAKAKGEKK